MAKASERKAGIETTSSRIGHGAIPDVNGCIRCGGLLVQELCLDFFHCTGEAEARRCIQCGEVVDPVILKNRRGRWAPRQNQSVQQGRTE